MVNDADRASADGNWFADEIEREFLEGPEK